MVPTVIVLGLGLILALIVAFIVIALLIQIATQYGMRCYYAGCLRPSRSAVFHEPYHVRFWRTSKEHRQRRYETRERPMAPAQRRADFSADQTLACNRNRKH